MTKTLNEIRNRMKKIVESLNESEGMFDTPEYATELEKGIDVDGKIVVLDKASIGDYAKEGDAYRLAAVYSKDTVDDTRTYFFSYMISPVSGFRGSRIDIMGIASPEQFKEFVKKYPIAGRKLLEIDGNGYVGYDVDPEYKKAAEEGLKELFTNPDGASCVIKVYKPDTNDFLGYLKDNRRDYTTDITLAEVFDSSRDAQKIINLVTDPEWYKNPNKYEIALLKNEL